MSMLTNTQQLKGIFIKVENFIDGRSNGGSGSWAVIGVLTGNGGLTSNQGQDTLLGGNGNNQLVGNLGSDGLLSGVGKTVSIVEGLSGLASDFTQVATNLNLTGSLTWDTQQVGTKAVNTLLSGGDQSLMSLGNVQASLLTVVDIL